MQIMLKYAKYRLHCNITERSVLPWGHELICKFICSFEGLVAEMCHRIQFNDRKTAGLLSY